MRVPFPYDAVRMQAVPMARGRSRLGSRSLSGIDQPVATGGGYWMIQCQFMIEPEGQRRWSAFLAQMRGSLGVTDLPVIRGPGVDLKDGGTLQRLPLSVGVQGNPTFEHFGFERSQYPWVTLVADADLRATQLLVQNDPKILGLRPGDLFSIDARLYEVVTHSENADGTSNLQIWPPLRQAQVAGDLLDVTFPTCAARLSGEAVFEPEDRNQPLWIAEGSMIEAVL